MTVSRRKAPSILDTMASLRLFLSRNIASVMFLGFYFITIVAGNLLYATPIGADSLRSTGFPTEALSFPETFTFGYWALLLMPFVAVPVIVSILKRAFSRVIVPFALRMPDFRPADYAVVAAVLYVYVFWIFWHTGAFALAGSGHTALAAVEARFTMQARMVFYQKIAIQSLLPFIAFYAVVAALRLGGRFWWISAIVTVPATSVFLIALSMKWPALVFFVGIVAAVFIFSARYAYLKAIIGVAILVAMYLLISTYVFRDVTPVPHAPPTPHVVQAQPRNKPTAPATVAPSTTETPVISPKPSAIVSSPKPPATHPLPPSSIEGDARKATEYSLSLATSSIRFAPLLFAHLVNRMAIAYPYYYQIFTEEGQVCGSLLGQLKTHANVKCRPSYLVYERIFGQDGFAGRGTAPAAAHITDYALGGWPLAIAAMIGICIVLTVFSCIPLDAGIMSATFVVVGATTGYHLSQVPGEGAVFYPHGFLWPFLLFLAYFCFKIARSRLFGRTR